MGAASRRTCSHASFSFLSKATGLWRGLKADWVLDSHSFRIWCACTPGRLKQRVKARAAAPVPLRNCDDIAQNGPSVPQIPTAANASARSSPTGALMKAAAISPTAPASAELATCHRRSPVRSELLPMTTIPKDAARYGMALRNPTIKLLNPEKD